MLANGGLERDSGNGLTVKKRYCHRLRTAQSSVLR